MGLLNSVKGFSKEKAKEAGKKNKKPVAESVFDFLISVPSWDSSFKLGSNAGTCLPDTGFAGDAAQTAIDGLKRYKKGAVENFSKPGWVIGRLGKYGKEELDKAMDTAKKLGNGVKKVGGALKKIGEKIADSLFTTNEKKAFQDKKKGESLDKIGGIR